MASFSPDTGGFISRQAGKDGIAAYKNSTAFTALSGIKAHAFGKNKLTQIIGQTDCVGIRVWHGMDSTGKPQLYIVGVDSNGDDILTSGTELVLDLSLPCPQHCPTSTSLEN